MILRFRFLSGFVQSLIFSGVKVLQVHLTRQQMTPFFTAAIVYTFRPCNGCNSW